jgi:hypothetical protein
MKERTAKPSSGTMCDGTDPVQNTLVPELAAGFDFKHHGELVAADRV